MILGPCFYDLNKSICVCVWTQKNKKRRKFAEADNGKPSVTDRLHITQKLRLKKCSGESIIKVKLGAINPLKATYNHFFLIFDFLWKVYSPHFVLYSLTSGVSRVVFLRRWKPFRGICGQFAMEVHWQRRRKCSDVSGLKIAPLRVEVKVLLCITLLDCCSSVRAEFYSYSCSTFIYGEVQVSPAVSSRGVRSQQMVSEKQCLMSFDTWMSERVHIWRWHMTF